MRPFGGRVTRTAQREHTARMQTAAVDTTPQQRREIGARIVMPERTVLRVYRTPTSVQPATLERVRRAAVELGYPPPPPRTPNEATR